MRRVYVIYGLILAVLAASFGLAYYGYSFAREVHHREREMIADTTRELAEEKVLSIESQILDTNQKLLDGIRLDPIPNLTDLIATTGANVTSVFVLDLELNVLPGGHYSSRAPDAGRGFLIYFRQQILPSLELASLARGQRAHVHRNWEFRPYLFSYMRKAWRDREYFVVIETDLSYLVGILFPQTLSVRSSRLYQVVDERGDLVYGAPFSSEDYVELPFADMLDKWRLRVAQKDLGTASVSGRRHLIDMVLIGLAVTVIAAGLVFFTLAMRRERRANDLKSEFISNVSHELKTPLSIISMFGEMLALGRIKSSTQATEYAEIIWRESVRLGRLIDNVLDFSKIERGQGGYEFAMTDPADVVTRAIEISQRRLSQAAMELHPKLDAVPATMLDANAYTLAALNLIDNAIKYAAAGKRLELRLFAEAGRIVLEVQDHGPGIPPAEHQHIFERFYRAKDVRLKPIRGSGIGLALVQHIAHAHHGTIAVTSSVGNGATFRLTIPIVETPAEA